VAFLVTVNMMFAAVVHAQSFPSLDTLYAFTGQGDGGTPVGALVQVAGGDFYGASGIARPSRFSKAAQPRYKR